MEQQEYLEKGEMGGNAVGNIITLIVGVGVAVLVLILVGSLGGKSYELVQDDISIIGNHPIVNDPFTCSNVSAQSLTHGFVQEGTLIVKNGTVNGVTVGLGNFTIDYDAGTLLLKSTATETTFHGTSMYANYTWGVAEARNSIQNSVVSSFEALENTGDYLPVIVLAVVIALVLALVLGSTVMMRGKGGYGGAL